MFNFDDKVSEHYYSKQQYNIMSARDANAKIRSDVHGNGLICLSCGSTDLFMVKHSVRIKISYTDSTMNVEYANPEDKIKIGDIFKNMTTKNVEIVCICMRCGGAAMPYSYVLDKCEEDGCPGCFVCGRVTNRDDMISIISACPNCFGGELGCYETCINKYMREYHDLRKL